MLRLHWYVPALFRASKDESGADAPGAGKPVPKTFAVCTIRSTPSTAHHCIAWAKSYLLPCALSLPTPFGSLMASCSQLFGADDEADGQDLDDAEKNGENGALLAPPR